MLGRSYEDIRAGLRGVPLDGYIILYQVTANTLEILRVVHGSRNLKALFESEEQGYLNEIAINDINYIKSRFTIPSKARIKAVGCVAARISSIYSNLQRRTIQSRSRARLTWYQPAPARY